jgi:5-methyltetrahydrofolate--homocysteine methyltransferase
VTRALSFSDSGWERVERNWTAWWQGETDRPMVILEAMTDPRFSLCTWSQHLTTYPLSQPAEEIVDALDPQFAALDLYADAFPKWFPNFGPGVVAAFLGSPVDASTGTTWFHPCGLALDADLAFRADGPWWERVAAVARAGRARWGGRAVIGHTDLGGNLDILASLRGTQQLLLDLCDAPRDVERLLGQVTSLWLRYYDAYCELIAPAHRGFAGWAPLWFPGRGYMLQSDFAYMISPAMFERLVMPDLTACCAALDYAFYHLDGKGQIKHLDMLLSIDRLRGIQWIPGDGAAPPEEWLPLLKRIRDAGKLCQLYVTLEGALIIARELGGKGFAFCIGSGRYLSIDEANDALGALQAAGLLDEPALASGGYREQ